MGNFAACATTMRTKLPGALNVVICATQVYPGSPPVLAWALPRKQAGHGVNSVAKVERSVRAIIFGLLVLLLAACNTGHKPANSPAKLSQKDIAQQRLQQLLVPKQVINGGLLATLDVHGLPVPGEARGFTTFIFPSALASRGSDLYIADSGARKLYRFNTAMQVMGVVSGETVLPWTRIQVGMDRSLYVLDTAQRVIRHYPPGGQPVHTMGDPSAMASLDSFVIKEGDEIIASDNLNRRLLMFNSLGGPGWPISTPAIESGLPSLGAMVSAGRAIYAIDSGCPCIVALDDSGQVAGQIGRGELVQPQELAADRLGHIFVSDQGDRTLKVFLRGKLIANYAASALQFMEITALAVEGDTLYVADGPASKVLAFHIQTPIEQQ